jgi:ribonuclease HI
MNELISQIEQDRTEPKPKARYVAQIYFDGGCGPTNPGNKYGSFELRINGGIVDGKNRATFGRGTNNEAEFDALLLAMEALNNYYLSYFIDPDSVRVAIQTDSTIVRNWLNRFHKFNRSKCKNERRLVMADYAGKCIERLKPFHSFNIEWKGRAENVARFGH